jgi:adenosylcobinamide kinase/adenosylcobinamide-phosphate guanylyltransferase
MFLTVGRTNWIKGKFQVADNSLLTMVIGGASSGKSSFAERLVMSSPAPHFYLATAQAYDDEMNSKIQQHRIDRQDDGWQTVEAPLDLIGAISAMPSDASLLLDCATMWLNNLIMAEKDTRSATEELTNFLINQTCNITVVTNEVGLGIVPENKLARKFRIAQGALNASLAANSDRVYCVMAGLPFALKGELP